MHPLEALGLARDADERAVKRAYAQRLKTTRPEDDPAGFQKLHETYQSALSYVRWRAENPEDEEEFDEDEGLSDQEAEGASATMSSAEFEALIGNPRYTDAPQPAVESEAPRPPPDVRRVTEMPEPFRLDVREFLKSLFAQTEDLDEGRLKAWLVRETADWPLVVMPRVAHDVLTHMVEREPDLTAEQLEVVVAHFGFDDVLSGANPMHVQQLRIEATKQLRKRRAKFAHLFHPRNRGELARYMSMAEQGGGYPQIFTRFVVYLLTSRRAYEWAFALRPIPFLNRLVMGFLRNVDQGRFDAFASHLDDMALSFWEWAEMRREANRAVRYIVVIVGLLAGLAYVTRDGPGNSPPSASSRPGRTVVPLPDLQREQAFADRIPTIIAMENDRAVGAYDALFRELPPPPWSPLVEQVAALSHYNRAIVLGQLNRPDEAKASYEAVDRLFGRSVNWPVQLITAKALVNLGNLLADRRAYRESLAPYGLVMARYGDIRRDVFELQIAMALLARARAFQTLEQPGEARHALDDLLRRFGDKTEGDLGELVAKAKERRAALDRQGAVPSEVQPPAGRP